MSKTSTDGVTPSLKRCINIVLPHLDTILAMLSIGHTRTATAKAVGIKPWNFLSVLREGKASRGRCHDILKSVLSAEGKAQVNLEAIVIADAKVNVKSAQWLLARRFRLKERHEPDIEVLRKLDYNKLDQEEIKLRMLEQKLRLLTETKGEDLNGEGWRSLMSEATEANKRIKSLH